MSLFSSIGRSLGSIIKPLASMALQSIAPAAANLLKSVAGDFFGGGAAALKLATSGLPGPLSSLANKLIDWGVGGIQNFANSGIDALVSKVTGAAHTVDVNGQSTVVPSYTSRGSTSYASTATVGNYGSTVGNYGTGNNIGTAGASSGIGALPNLNTTPTDQIKAELKAKYPNLKPEDLDMMAAQEAEQRYNRMISLLTQLLTMKHEATKSIIQNFRA